MVNSSVFIEFGIRRSLFMDNYSELVSLSPRNGLRLLWLVFLLAFLWIYSAGVQFTTFLFFPLKTRQPVAAVFFAAFHEKIRKVFKCQREETFSVLSMGVDRVMRRGSGETSMILLLAPEGALDTANVLVTLLVHCVLIGYQQPADHCHVKTVIVDSAKYVLEEDEWKFFSLLRRHLRRRGVAAVRDAQRLHPRVMRSLQHLNHISSHSSHLSVLVLVMDVRRRFTEHQLMTTPANSLGSIFLEELLGPFLSASECAELVNLLTARCAIVLPEPVLPQL